MMTMLMMDESVNVSFVICLHLCQCKSTFSPLNGLERSKTVHGGLCTVSMEVYVLCPWRSMHCVHGGLILTTVYVSDGLERSQFWSHTQDGLEGSHLWVVIFSWALALACCCSL